MIFYIANEVGTDISSRHYSALLRARVELAADNGGVVLDFHGVRTISEGWAHEFFGILIQRRGEDWFKENVKVIGLNKYCRASVLEVLARLEQRV